MTSISPSKKEKRNRKIDIKRKMLNVKYFLKQDFSFYDIKENIILIL